jgi:hypothetical protein
METTTLKIVKRIFPIKTCDKNHQETKIRNSRSNEQNAWILKMFLCILVATDFYK